MTYLGLFPEIAPLHSTGSFHEVFPPGFYRVFPPFLSTGLFPPGLSTGFPPGFHRRIPLLPRHPGTGGHDVEEGAAAEEEAADVDGDAREHCQPS